MLHRTRLEVEYARLYKPPMSYGTTVWSPLASGLLTGKYSNKQFQGGDNRLGLTGNLAFLRTQLETGQGLNGLEEKNVDRIMEIVENLRPIAEKLGATLAQLCLAWVAKNPNVSTVITGASRSNQVTENFKAITFIPKLTPDIMEEIEQALKNKPKHPFDWTTMQ
jgi:aryl-alcohol dehydrogenase-like predicted oxidoreductase